LSEVDILKQTIPDALPSFNLQLLTKNEIALFSKKGGSSLGIKKEDGPLFRTSTVLRSTSNEMLTANNI
jgi:hypothetical protein